MNADLSEAKYKRLYWHESYSINASLKLSCNQLVSHVLDLDI
jgi:hypothetical protein